MSNKDSQKPATPRQSLTPQHRAAYDFIRTYIEKHGRGPSVRDVGTALGLKSPNNAIRILKALQDRGYIVHSPAPTGRPRAMEHLAACQSSLKLPILGCVAAGDPLEVWEPDDDSFDFQSAFGGGDTFLVRVRGESMIERHIAPGDLVVVRRSETAEHGDEVVARVNGGLTLKIYQQSRTGEFAGKWLFPANKSMQPIRFDSRDAVIIGVVEGVIRRTRKRH